MEAVSTAVCLSSTARVIDIDITRALFAVTQRLLWRELDARFGSITALDEVTAKQSQT